MATIGDGAILIWNDITAEGRADFYAWHVGEHIAERLAIPGFRRGRRAIAIDAATSPEFFTLYELTDKAIATSAPYLARLNDPTPWTVRAQTGFRNMVRALATVEGRAGAGPGGIVATLRAGSLPPAATANIVGDLLPALAASAEITGVTFSVTDAGASALKTQESRNRGDHVPAPAATLLIEGCNEVPVRAASARAAAALAAAGAGPLAIGHYRLEHIRSAA